MIAGTNSSLLVTLVVAGAMTASAQTISRVSVDVSGTPGNGESTGCVVSLDGSTEAFVSEASNFVANDTNGQADIFVRNRSTGVITRASVSSTGVQGQFQSAHPVLSMDGLVVAFESDAYNLVPMDVNGSKDIFAYEVLTGTTTRVSLSTGGGEVMGNSFNPTISGDGRFVAFDATARYDTGDTNGYQDIYMTDRLTGVTTRVNLGPGGAQSNDFSGSCQLSSDGLWIAFVTRATNIVLGDANRRQDVILRELSSGVNYLCSVSSSGEQANNDCSLPSISADGRYVVFQSSATNLVAGDTNNQSDIFVYDRVSLATELVSLTASGGQANGFCGRPAISGDARYVVFQSTATNLVVGDTNALGDIFVRDRVAGTTARVSVAGGCAFTDGASTFPAISGDGGVIVFQSSATNLVANDTNGFGDTFENVRGAIGVDAVVPRSGSEAGGDLVKLSGVGLAGTGATTVTFGGVAGTVVDANPSFVRVLTPPGTGTVDVVVSNSNGCITAPTNFTYVAPEIAARFGNVNMAFGDRADVFTINGGTGNALREVSLGTTDGLLFTMTAPPANTHAAPFALYAWAGAPDASNLAVHPGGLGYTVFPTPVSGGGPQPIRIWNNLGFRQRLGVPSYPSSPAPSTILNRRTGAHRAVIATFQGFIQDDGSLLPQRVSITNAIILRIQ
ncbi:MAG: PD40 domain-containing protein [Planctomycetes bacterium]|nr:PD40 domain-containing protein [Planctomycetota bacterium]